VKSVDIDVANCKFYAPELFVRFHGRKIMIGNECASCAVESCGHNLKAHGNKDTFALVLCEKQ
jgi:hypothetical protein